MGSERLRLSQVRDAFRLLGEVRELGGDTLAWRGHMIAGLCRLLDAPVGMGGEIPPGAIMPTASVDMGWGTPRDRREWVQFMAGGDNARDPVVLNSIALRGSRYALSRRQLVADAQWYGTSHFDVRRRAGLDDSVTCSVPLPAAGWVQSLMLLRPWNERPFSESERRLVDLFQEELARCWAPGPLAPAAPSADLSPRQRQVLARLLAGDSEKQAARHLGIAHQTAHNHVTSLHRHFRVRTRGELFACCRRASSGHPRLQLDASGPPAHSAAPGPKS